MDLKSYLINNIIEDKNIIEELILIDNKIQFTNFTYELLLEALKSIKECDILENDLNLVALTDGEFNTVFRILISVPNLSILYVNRCSLGINKYLVRLVNDFYGYEKIKLDDTINYTKYINSENKIILSGFDTFVEELLKEFNNKEIIVI